MWESLFEPWRVCLALAWESYCEGSVPIAAVVINAGGRILSQARNRRNAPPEPRPNQVTGGQLAHAELNALLALELLSTDVYAVELFSLVEPCPLCIGAICMVGVKTVRYAARDSWSGSTDLLDASPYLRWKSIKAIPPQDKELETIVHMLQVAEQLRSGHPRTEEVLQKWNGDYPDHVRKGRMLYQSGALERLRSEGASAKEVVTYLYELSRTIE